MVWVIGAAWGFARRRCLALLTSNWLPDKSRDLFTWNCFLDLKESDQEAINIVCRVARRSFSQADGLYWLAHCIREAAPDFAPQLVAVNWEESLRSLKGLRERTANGDADDEPKAETWSTRYNACHESARFLESSKNAYELEEMAKAAPKVLLTNLWPLYVRVVLNTLDDPHRYLLQYRRGCGLSADLDLEDHTSNPTTAMKQAVQLFAAQHSGEFLNLSISGGRRTQCSSRHSRTRDDLDSAAIQTPRWSSFWRTTPAHSRRSTLRFSRYRRTDRSDCP